MIESPFSKSNPHLQVAWDSVSMGYFKTCPYKYFLHIIQGWTPKKMAPPLDFGIRLHSAIEYYARQRAEGLTHKDAMLLATRRAFVLARDLNEEEDKTRADGVVVTAKRTKFNYLRTVIWYLDEHADDSWEIIKLQDGKPAAELSFRVALPFQTADGEPYLLCGHLDYVKINGLGEVEIHDLKHTAWTLDESYFQQYSPSNQMTGYIFAGSIILPKNPKRLVIDAAQIAQGFSRFERGSTSRTESQLNEWVDDYGVWIKIAEKCATDGHWPMNDTSCHMYGGCMFRDVCSKAPSVRDIWLKQDFEKKEPWNPLKNRGD